MARAPGQALSDFRIFKLIAEAWGCAEMFRKWESPEATFQLLKACSEGMPCDITGIDDYHMLDEKRGIQWPLPDGQSVVRLSERRLFEDGQFYTPDRRARFVFEAPRPWPEPTTPAYPFTLLTGRGSSSQWHTQTRTGKSDVLRKLYPNVPYVELSPRDAAELGIRANERVIVRSQRGQVRARAFVSHVVQPGQVYMPMHDAATKPADVCGIRSVLAATVVQGVCSSG